MSHLLNEDMHHAASVHGHMQLTLNIFSAYISLAKLESVRWAYISTKRRFSFATGYSSTPDFAATTLVVQNGEATQC